MIAGATGVPQRFYRGFAQYAAAHGYTTLTLDYRDSPTYWATPLPPRYAAPSLHVSGGREKFLNADDGKRSPPMVTTTAGAA